MMYSDLAKTLIKDIKNKNSLSWEDLRNGYGNQVISQALKVLDMAGKTIPADDWIEFIDLLESEDPANQTAAVSFGENYENNAELPTDSYSCWQGYKKYLQDINWSEKSISNLEISDFNILKKLATDNTDKTSRKGLVIGNIQSGKTANMTGLIAQASDNGFNMFIVLSGMIESLRMQTQNRLINDLNKPSNLNWKFLDRPSLRSSNNSSIYNINHFDFSSDSRNRYLTVSLKNKKRLEDLYNWMTKNKDKQRQMKVILIDDEADQASINTKDIDSNERTAINDIIRKIVNDRNFGAMNYIAYTATPFANILNESGNDTLYPKDFIELLEPAEDYIGARQIFGTENPEYSPGIDIVQPVSLLEAKLVRDAKKLVAIPYCLKEAINWFILSLAAMRSYGYNKPISMMIHTSFRIADHEKLSDLISDYLCELKKEYPGNIAELENLYKTQQNVLPLERFKAAMPNYTIKNIQNYPNWADVKRELDYLFEEVSNDDYLRHIGTAEDGALEYSEGIHLCVDNSQTKGEEGEVIRLLYPDKPLENQKAPAFIVIGGNTLSRGLTIEGLISTYFIRATNMADTLLQMARWFGFRHGYELMPRIWMDANSQKRYAFISQLNEEMREYMAAYATNGLTPLQYIPKIKESPSYSLIRITSTQKMQSAEPAEYNFAGFSTQTTTFNADKESLEENIHATDVFMDKMTQIAKPELKDQHYVIWRNVSNDLVLSFFKDYKPYQHDKNLSNMPNLIEWLDANEDSLDNWNVIAVGKKQSGTPWKIGDYSITEVTRTKKAKSNKTADSISIGVLKGPADVFADIDVNEREKKVADPVTVRAIRNKYSVGNIPQLLIYRVDKDSKAKDNSDRVNLNAPADLIGLNIMLPASGVKHNSSNIGYISLNPITVSETSIDANQIGEDINDEE